MCARNAQAREVTMRVNVYHVDQNTGAESVEARDVMLAEMFPDDSEVLELMYVCHTLERDGNMLYGGGASPLFHFYLIS
jgi:hypothetical protein